MVVEVHRATAGAVSSTAAAADEVDAAVATAALAAAVRCRAHDKHGACAVVTKHRPDD